MSQRSRNIARRRLKRDLIELERANILSIAAHPLEDNVFEWHVNIKPTDGVYSGVYFHLIMTFPDSYPANPPEVKICTPISHPNIFGSFLCLSMLRSHTGNVPYEGWSGAYSVTSVLMQLQSFLFAEKIDQDGGYTANAQLTDHDVKESIRICKEFQCKKCKHSHISPWPRVKGPPEALIKVFPTDPESGHVVVQGSAAQTTHTYWVGAYGEFGCNYGKVFYEAFINWTGDKWRRNNIRGGLCRFGFGSQYASVCGRSGQSFGYGGTGMFSYNNEFDKFGESFTKDDTITVAIDFDSRRIYFAKNGKIMESNRALYIPQNLCGTLLYPILSFKNSRAEFNFGDPKKPCRFLIKNGFKTLEELAIEQGGKDGEADPDEYVECDDMKQKENININRCSYIIPELWLCIFSALTVQEVFSTQYVCKKWYQLICEYNIMERNEIYCYFTKAKLGQSKGGKILGIGFNIKESANGYGVDIHSQMDILSLNAWRNGCRIGVWGEGMSHFLPLVMNKRHSEIADDSIKKYLQLIAKMCYTKRTNNSNELDKYIDRQDSLRMVDALITMMNKIVVQFVIGNEETDANKVSMVMCEKVVLGYCALHHLLLYLSHKKHNIISFANRKISYFIHKNNGCDKSMCRDLGKFLIYLMISTQYSWSDVADIFVKEVLTRNVRWMVQASKYSKYDSTKVVNGRLKETFTASKISRRLVMFQVWFMKNTISETLKGYNQRLGRPQVKVRNGVTQKTKSILNSKSWWDYFNELDVRIRDEKTIDQLLRYAVYNSKAKGYHRSNNRSISKVNPPFIKVPNKGISSKFVGTSHPPETVQIGLKSGRGRGCAWRGRGTGRGRGRGRGRGMLQNGKKKNSREQCQIIKAPQQTQNVLNIGAQQQRVVEGSAHGTQSVQSVQNQQQKIVNNVYEPGQQPMSKSQRRKRRKNNKKK